MTRAKLNLLCVALCTLAVGAVIQEGWGEGGISGSGTYRGKIQRFASILVNDTELDTSSAQVTVNGTDSTVAALRVGQQVEIDAVAIELGQADSIAYFSSVWGPIQAVDTLAGTLQVLGQQVSTSAVTNFVNVDPAILAPGDWVEVSGIRNSPTGLTATYLRRTGIASSVRLTGELRRISATGVLRVAGVAIVTTEAQRAGLAIGDTLSVRGIANATGTRITAQRIHRVEESLATGENVSVEGVLTSATATRVVVDGQAFRLNSATNLINGTQAGLVPGVRLHVEAARAGADLFASAIVFKPTKDVRVEGVLEEVDLLTPDSARIRVSGLPLVITQGTDFGHSSKPELNLGGVEDLVVGDYLKVRGYVDGREGAVTRVDRTPFQDRSRITALVSKITPDGFELLGDVIAFSASTTFKVASESVSRNEFLAALRVGDFVEVRYETTWTPGMAADEIAIVDND
jgi:hypothetical protein